MRATAPEMELEMVRATGSALVWVMDWGSDSELVMERAYLRNHRHQVSGLVSPLH